jgi:hypothetical protein
MESAHEAQALSLLSAALYKEEPEQMDSIDKAIRLYCIYITLGLASVKHSTIFWSFSSRARI